MIGKTLGHYEIVEKIGAGGMGEVYRARDTRLGRQVALKLLPDRALEHHDALERFMREARAASSLNHPNICTVHDIGEHEGRHFIVMELLEGRTLEQRLCTGPLPIDEFLELAKQLTDALDTAHSNGILHRDIKPSNIFVTDRGLAKILDFGLARRTQEFKGDRRPEDETAALGDDILRTAPGTTMGTVAYMSPEQALGEKLDARSDTFSLGAVLYEMVTGRRAFPGNTVAAVFDAVLNQTPVSPIEINRDVPPELMRILAGAMEKNRDRRYQSVAALRSDLVALAETCRRATGETSPPVTKAVSSIAVLPFVNMSADPENEYFTDGMAEEIINALAKIEALRVASRTSSFAFKGKQEDARRIGQMLNVSTILEGSVRKVGNRLRITAQLVKVDDGYHLWSERYDRDLEDVFAVQDEIAESIASTLRLVLSARERNAIQKIPTKSMEAYDLYLRGLSYSRHQRDDNLRYAESFFRQAVEIDPEFALAWVGLAVSHWWLHTWFRPSDEVRRTAEDAARRALAIDPDLAEAHVARGLAATLSGQYVLASEELQTAARLDPRLFDAHYHHGRVCLSQGKLEDAARLFSVAAAVRPEDYQALTLLASCLRGLGRTEEAQAAARRALDVIARHSRLHPDDVRAVYFAASHWSALGEHEKALELASRALRMLPEDSGVRYNVACVYVGEGLLDEALDLLEKNVRAGWGYVEWVENDPDLEPLRGHPRYRQIIEKLSSRKVSDES